MNHICQFSIVLVFAGVAANASQSISASVVVSDWNMTTGVSDAVNYDFQYSNIVNNPFISSHQISRLQSNANTDFDFSWGSSGGTFAIDVSQHAQNTLVADVRCSSQGGIVMMPSVDVELAMSASYSYSLPDGYMSAGFFFLVSEIGPIYHDIFLRTFGDGPLPDYPVNTYSTTGAILLRAGQPYAIDYGFELDAYGSSNAAADGTGYVHFALTPVPEPTIGALFVAALLGYRPRVRR